MRRVVRHGCNVILPVMLTAHAARRRLITQQSSYHCFGRYLGVNAKGVSGKHRLVLYVASSSYCFGKLNILS